MFNWCIKIIEINHDYKLTIKKDDIFDVISGNILENPVRFMSNGRLINEVVDNSTAIKLNKCPFTQSTNFKIIPADDINEQLQLFKIFSKEEYCTILNNLEKEKQDFIDREKKRIDKEARVILSEVCNYFNNPIIYVYNPIFSYAITNTNRNIFIRIKDIIYQEHIRLDDNRKMLITITSDSMLLYIDDKELPII